MKKLEILKSFNSDKKNNNTDTAKNLFLLH